MYGYVLLEYTEIALEIAVNENKIFYRNIEHINVSDGMVMSVSELGAGLHHIEHRYRKIKDLGVVERKGNHRKRNGRVSGFWERSIYTLEIDNINPS